MGVYIVILSRAYPSIHMYSYLCINIGTFVRDFVTWSSTGDGWRSVPSSSQGRRVRSFNLLVLSALACVLIWVCPFLSVLSVQSICWFREVEERKNTKERSEYELKITIDFRLAWRLEPLSPPPFYSCLVAIPRGFTVLLHRRADDYGNDDRNYNRIQC